MTPHDPSSAGFNTEPTISFAFRNLSVLEGTAGGLPLSQLSKLSHVHGGLRVQVGDRIIPYMGYWNANDVCFGMWLQELDAVLKTFEGSDNAEYVSDEGEQGQPAYLFERQGDTVFLSIIKSQLSDGEADPEWQRVSFYFADFCEQYSAFRERLVSELRRAAPEWVDKWLNRLREA